MAVLKSRKNTKNKSKWALRYNKNVCRMSNKYDTNTFSKWRQERRFSFTNETLLFYFQK